MTWSSANPASVGSWIPTRPALLPALGNADAWTPDELEPFDSFIAGAEVPTEDVPDEAAIRAAEEAARARALAEEHEQALADAYARGLAEGEVAGRATEQARLADALLAAERALDALRAGESRWTGQIEENICALAVAVARQVMGRELAGDAATLTDLVRRALAEFPIDQPLTIRVNPLDLAAMASARPNADSVPTAVAGGIAALGTAAVAPNRDVRWIADPAVPAGGCVVEGRERIVDGRVDTALERIYRQLTGNHA